MSSKIEFNNQDKQYFYIIDGKFRTRVPEGTDGAIIREYETKDGQKGVKHELVAPAITGKIEDIYIHDGDFGKQIIIRLEETDDGITPILQFNVNSSFGRSVLEKLPAVDFDKPVTFRPYNFTDDNGKERKGVSITQDNGARKIINAFYDTENKKALIEGYPIVPDESKKWDKDDWKIFFIQRTKFMLKYLEENIISKFNEKFKKEFSSQGKIPNNVYQDEELNPDDVPF